MNTLIGRESGEDGWYQPILYSIFYAWKMSNTALLDQLPDGFSPITNEEEFEPIVNSSGLLSEFADCLIWMMNKYEVRSLMMDFFRDRSWAVSSVFDECFSGSSTFRKFCREIILTADVDVIRNYHYCSRSTSYEPDKVNATVTMLNALEIKPDLGYVVTKRRSNPLLMTLASRAKVSFEIVDISAYVTVSIFIDLLKMGAMISNTKTIIIHTLSYRHYVPLHGLAAYRHCTVQALMAMYGLDDFIPIYEFNEHLMTGGPYEDEKYQHCEINCLNHLCLAGPSSKVRFEVLTYILREGRYRNLYRTNITNDTMAYLFMICDWPVTALRAMYSPSNYDFQELMTVGAKRFKHLYLRRQEEVPINSAQNCFAALVRKMQ